MKVMLTLSPQSMKVAGAAIGLSTLLGGGVDLLRRSYNSITGGSATGLVDNVVSSIRNIVTFLFIDMQAMVVRSKIQRRLILHEIPGREGDVPQDLGGKSTVLTVAGRWIYENEPQDAITQLLKQFGVIAGLFGSRVGWNWLRLEMMKALARINVPLVLACDLFTGPVLIREINFAQAGGLPNVYEYSMTLIEWNPALSLVGTLVIGGGQLATGSLNRGF